MKASSCATAFYPCITPLFVRGIVAACLAVAASTVATAAEKPKIVKRGTIACDLVEATPVVFHDKLYRFEYVRDKYKHNKTGDAYFHFIDVTSGEATPAFAPGHCLGCAIAEGDTMFVYGVKGWDTPTIYVFWSKDLNTWQSKPAVETPNWGLFNSTVCKDDQGYVMAFEVGRPPEVVGTAFTTRFARSDNLLDWKVLDEPAVYSKEFYTACPAIRYLEGYYYMFHLVALPGPTYETALVRSRDLIHWEKSPRHPVLVFSDEDKQIANPKLTAEEREHIAKATNRNASDFDLCEYQGKVIISYSWGNQVGTEFLAEAYYDGGLKPFLQGFFDK
ncbi:MAG: hypothetical protein GX621_13835 [Pirellulaceae bacterium]|nr:hypothetical protein [Pirellulaceae bacterium]